MQIAYLSVHVTYCIVWTTVHVIKIATMDVHVRTRLIIVAICALMKMWTTIINAEINIEFSLGSKTYWIESERHGHRSEFVFYESITTRLW